MLYQITPRSIDELVPYARNARTHSDEQVALIMGSLAEFGWTNPILIGADGVVIAGHGRLMAARRLRDSGSVSIPEWPDLGTVPTVALAHLTEAQRRAYVLADNQLASRAGWDDELLKIELGELQADGFDLDLLGFEDDFLQAVLDTDLGGEDAAPAAAPRLADRFMVVPFSVLNAREGWWQDRKAGWMASGINSVAGRADNLAFSTSSQPPDTYKAKEAYEAKLGRKVTWTEFAEACPDQMRYASGTSVFDPVLCELLYRWFSPQGGVVLDPFAGGSVRGIVAAKLGRQYVGCDLRAEQVEENRTQWVAMQDDQHPAPVWYCGDSRLIDQHAAGVEADFVFSCPPYADLEVYSDDPSDLSTMDYPAFLAAYREIIAKSVAMLKPNRFAAFVVGEVRDKQGRYLDFVGDTVQAFRDAGADYYNEAILITQVGSLAIRVGKQFSTSRKLGKTHQNVLVFVKGDPKAATEACGPVDVAEFQAADGSGPDVPE